MKQTKDNTLESIISNLKDKLKLVNIPENVGLDCIFIELDNKVKSIKSAANGLSYLMILIMVLFGVSLYFNAMQFDRTDVLEFKILLMEQRDSLFRQIMKADSNMSISYRLKDGRPMTYHELEEENDSLRRKYYRAKFQNDIDKIKLDFINKNYNICIKHSGGTWTIIAPTIDSAMMLLPVYRDKLEYDSKENEWHIYK